MSERVNPDTGRPYGQATTRQFIRLVLRYTAERIVGPGILLAFQLGVIALAVWGIAGIVWGIIGICTN